MGDFARKSPILYISSDTEIVSIYFSSYSAHILAAVSTICTHGRLL